MAAGALIEILSLITHNFYNPFYYTIRDYVHWLPSLIAIRLAVQPCDSHDSSAHISNEFWSLEGQL